jgi:hypothetical protein
MFSSRGGGFFFRCPGAHTQKRHVVSFHSSIQGKHGRAMYPAVIEMSVHQ